MAGAQATTPDLRFMPLLLPRVDRLPDGAESMANEPMTVKVSEASCFSSFLHSDLACPELLANDTEAAEYSSACDELIQSEVEEDMLGAPSPCAKYSLTPLLDTN